MNQQKKFKVQMNHTTTVHQGKIFKLTKENITLQDRITVELDIIRHPGAGGIVAITNKNEIVLIKQYRHAIGKFVWEIPAGLIETDESPLDCAKRELQEEAGFSAKNWQSMGPIAPLPGYSDERVHMFLATDLFPAPQHTDIDEIIEVYKINFDEAVKMIVEGEILDSKTISGLFMAKQRLNPNHDNIFKKGMQP